MAIDRETPGDPECLPLPHNPPVPERRCLVPRARQDSNKVTAGWLMAFPVGT